MKPRSVVASRIVGVAALVQLAVVVVLGLFVTEPDVVQRQAVRLIYVHPSVAWVAYVAFGVTALTSALYLWRRTRDPRWDLLAGASGEIGVVFCGLMLTTGMIWGRPTWGVWWTWDARLTSAAVLFVLFLGYLALRRVPGDPAVRAKRSAIAALLAFADVPIVHLSVEWWRTLHQEPSVLRRDLDPTIEGLQLWTMLLSFVAFTTVYAWLLIHRYRLARWESRIEEGGLEAALAERRAEGGARTPSAPPVPAPAPLAGSVPEGVR